MAQDIIGLTASGGRARLPNTPESVVAVLAVALEAHGRATLPQLVDYLAKKHHVDRTRAAGLLGWLPLSHLAMYNNSGVLFVDKRTNLLDLAIRFASWASTQPVAEEQAKATRVYAEQITICAREWMARGRGVRDANTFVMAELVAPSTPAPTKLSGMRAKLHAIVNHLDANLLERGEQLRASLLALLAGQHVLLLGPPGTAKSLLARGLCSAFSDASYFEYLLSRFTHPDELFGPVSIPGLKEEDYRRLTEGFLPHAHVAFLDEIFKANSAILNSLLTLINERIFHHGRHRDPVPLLGVVGASNELPDPDGGLGALYDRFLVRLTVPPLAHRSSFRTLVGASDFELEVPSEVRLTLKEVAELRERAKKVTLSASVADALTELWAEAHEQGWMVSDRRWRQAVALLSVAAAADERTEVQHLDLLLLASVLPPTPDEALSIREQLMSRVGAGAIPEHDLRAQWFLLSNDRVSPAGPGDVIHQREHKSWQEQQQRRIEQLQLYRKHLHIATQQLAKDRANLDEQAISHPFLTELPSQVLANHLTAARDLAHLLSLAEQYNRELATPQSMCEALFKRIPETHRRAYGHGTAVQISIKGTPLVVAVTLTGEKEPPPKKDGLVRPMSSNDAPTWNLPAEEFLSWLHTGEGGPVGLPAYSSRNADTALHALREKLGRRAIPSPPQARTP